MIRKFLDLSNAHVSETTAEWLHDMAMGKVSHTPHLSETDAGWFIWADPEPDDDVPGDLQNIMVYARQQDCDYIMLDVDAEVISELPTWDW